MGNELDDEKSLDDVSRMIKQHPGLEKEHYELFRLVVDGLLNTTTRVLAIHDKIQTARRETAEEMLETIRSFCTPRWMTVTTTSGEVVQAIEAEDINKLDYNLSQKYLGEKK